MGVIDFVMEGIIYSIISLYNCFGFLQGNNKNGRKIHIQRDI